MIRLIILFSVIFHAYPSSTAHAIRDPYPVNLNLDIRHYRFHLALNDSTDAVAGKAEITLNLTGKSPSFDIDLVSRKADGTGMVVSAVEPASAVETFQQAGGDKLRITLRPGVAMPVTLVIHYSGIPADGLIIGKNKFGNRGFFGDNWPDRGHYWLPCVDHPSDKASVEFLVTAPEHYSVVATGRLMETSALDRGRKLTHWSEPAPVPVKVMTIGAARFAVRQHGLVDGTELSTWVYPQDREKGFADFACADSIFRFFNSWTGPFAFAKLAHVQSKTRWGGLENAGAIFYSEKAVTGARKIESLVAHESAHQWFGDCATENDWHHVWLSEGFATYFAHLYAEYAHGENARRKNMARDRDNILKNELLPKSPVVDTTITDINSVLSIITYQKASWVLHMLRREIGDEQFQKAVRLYYSRYRNSNALTRDFQVAVGEVAGRDLAWFFNQWIFTPGAPALDIRWAYDARSKSLKMKVRQTGKSVFQFPLTITDQSGRESQTIRVDGREAEFSLKFAEKPQELRLDPEVNLLFEAKITPGRL